MPPDPRMDFPVMCLTQDGLGLSHAAQAGRLCAAGARWIQLRMKGATSETWLAEAAATADACRGHGALLVVNDSVEVALASGADGVHLGGPDADWPAARRRIGDARILGGTVNSADDARRALASGCLDYAGVGPFRFTSTKRNLAPVLGLEGVRTLIDGLRGIPAWVIGGILPGDLPDLRAAGAAGAAVSSGLYLGGRLEQNFQAFLEAWAQAAQPAAAATRR